VGDDPAQLARLRTAMASEPLLRAGAMLPERVSRYLQAAAAHEGA
jgi:hypothetical protein